MNKLNIFFMFLALSTTTIALSMHMGMVPDERRATLEGLRSYTTAELDEEITEKSELVQELEGQLDASQHRLQHATTEAERALIESRYYILKNDKDWHSDLLELLRQARGER